MERLIIIDHLTHSAYIEDVSDKDLECYCGDEEAYIEDNYNVTTGNYSWDYVTDIEYFGEENKDPIEVEPKDWL